MHRCLLRWLFAVMLGLGVGVPNGVGANESTAKKIVLIAGKKSHGPGAHEYEKDVKLLKHCLDTSPNAKGVKTEAHFGGWPSDPATLDTADAIVLFSDGLDKQYPIQQHPFLKGDHLAVVERQLHRGCGLAVIHWPLWVPGKVGQQNFTPWLGGFCDYENPPQAGMSDRVDWSRQLEHPICRGLAPFTFQDEYYGNVRFQGSDPRFTPILPFPGKPKEPVWAWAWQRDDGGRSFAFIGGHSHANWQIDPLRKTILNAILWSAKAEIPVGGVSSTVADRPAATASRPIKALILTGHHHPGHPWRESTRAIQEVLWHDARFVVDVAADPEALAAPKLSDYDVVVMNYCNWERPGLSQAARSNLLKYVTEGGGLVVSHFANGAFGPGAHPPATRDNWPEYNELCRRIWIDGRSSHDPFGPFRVEITGVKHPITAGLKAFDTVDELYFNQQGSLPIDPLATARSKVTGKDEPMAFAYTRGKGRVFQTLLGHAVQSIANPGEAELLCRGCVWVAGREQAAVRAAALPSPYNPARFGRALNAADETAMVPADPAFVGPPLTVQCWAKLHGKSGFNILVSNEPKTSGTHWELYSYAGTGCLSAYLPGYGGEIKSAGDITDGRWHAVAMLFEPQQVRLYVDGVEVARQAIGRNAAMKSQPGPLAVGLAYSGDHKIGCDGLVDEVRISRGLRIVDRVPEGPFAADGDTLGLWHFDDDPRKLGRQDASGHRRHADLHLKPD
jgi:type 1 glutamine amidotransferase